MDHLYATSGGSVNGQLPLAFVAYPLPKAQQRFGFTQVIGVQVAVKIVGSVNPHGDWVMYPATGVNASGMSVMAVSDAVTFLANDSGTLLVPVTQPDIRTGAFDNLPIRVGIADYIRDAKAQYPGIPVPTDPAFAQYSDSISATDASPVMRAYACAKSAQPTGSDAVPLTVPSGAPTQHQ